MDDLARVVHESIRGEADYEEERAMLETLVEAFILWRAELRTKFKIEVPPDESPDPVTGYTAAEMAYYAAAGKVPPPRE